MYEINQQKIRELITENGLRFRFVAEKLGIDPRTLYRRLQDPDGKGWTGAELAVLATILHTEPSAFFALKLA
ncbi:MAG: hypothetical protein IJ906_06425 [Oscillospiraceae bacterium]|nr:hypothetical protein [Oscillospiraceae bacterium]